MNSQYALLSCFTLLLLLIMTIYLLTSYWMASETFSGGKSTLVGLPLGPIGVNDQNKIMDPQGSNNYEHNPDLSTVDGTKEGPRSMAMFGYNRVAPECCPSEYTGNGGCVCETENQRKFRSSRGLNNVYGDDNDF
jgi:hypothetical protein